MPIYDLLSLYDDLQMEAIIYFNKLDEPEKEKVFVEKTIFERDIELRRKEKYSVAKALYGDLSYAQLYYSYGDTNTVLEHLS